MLPLALALVFGLARAGTQGTDADGTERMKRREDLQRRAQEILSQNQHNEITTVEARRRVQLLLKDLGKWSKTYQVELDRRTRTFSSPAVGAGEILTADRCPLFYEETLKRLCPLDFSRSEVWGASVVFCRYLCAPEGPDGSGESGEIRSSRPIPCVTSSR